jgi:hypothetical protein
MALGLKAFFCSKTGRQILILCINFPIKRKQYRILTKRIEMSFISIQPGVGGLASTVFSFSYKVFGFVSLYLLGFPQVPIL